MKGSLTTIGAINNFIRSYACGYQRLQKTALVADTYVDHSFIVLCVCLLLMALVMVCCIVGPNGAAKQQDFSYKLMIHGGCRAVANCPLVCPTLTLSVTKMRRKISFFYQRFIFLCPAIQKWSQYLLPTLKKWI